MYSKYTSQVFYFIFNRHTILNLCIGLVERVSLIRFNKIFSNNFPNTGDLLVCMRKVIFLVYCTLYWLLFYHVRVTFFYFVGRSISTKNILHTHTKKFVILFR